MLIPAMTYWDSESKIFVHQTIMQEDGIPLVSNRFKWGQAFDRTISIKVKLLNSNAKLPTRSHFDDAGMDIYAAENVILKNRFSGMWSSFWHKIKSFFVKTDGMMKDPSRATISTGLAFEVPQGLGFFVHDRSGLSSKSGLHRVAGVLDASFRGELKIALVNLSNKDYEIKIGDRIAQAVIAPIILGELIQANELTDTVRGDGGMGSTGK